MPNGYRTSLEDAYKEARKGSKSYVVLPITKRGSSWTIRVRADNCNEAVRKACDLSDNMQYAHKAYVIEEPIHVSIKTL